MATLSYLLTLILAFFAAPLLAQQPTQPVRIEIPLNSDYTETEVIPVPDSSLLVYIKVSDTWNTNAKFSLAKYDHKLEEVWDVAPELPADISFIRHFIEMPFAYLVFKSDEQDEYVFVKLHLYNGRLTSSTHKLKDISTIYEFNVLKGKFFIIGNSEKSMSPVLIHLDSQDEKVKLLPAIYGEESSFSDMLADPIHERLNVVVTESNGKISRLQVKTFNPDGKLLKNHFVLQQNARSLLNAEITPGDSTQKLLIGTFGFRDLRYTRGFFTLPVNASQGSGEFQNLLQLRNFLKYLKPKKEGRIRKKETQRVNTGKDSGLRYRTLLHDLITIPNGYILAAEIYYPIYSSLNSSTSVNRSLLVNDSKSGYKRSHAVALAFDKKGVLLWDNCFKLKNLSTFDLVHALEVSSTSDDKVIMAYPNKDKIIYHIMVADKYEDKEQELILKTKKPDDKIISTEYSGITKWYDANFAAFGFQRIKPANTEPYTVFYINKISF